MKKTVCLSTLALLMLFAGHSIAQVNFGLKAGLNMANMLNKDKDETYSKDYTMKPGFHIGATAEFSLSENFAVEPGLLFSTKGYKYDIKDADLKLTTNLNYLEIPVNAILKINMGSAKLLLSAGPYLGYAISGKVKADKAVLGENEDKKEEKIEIGSDKEKDELKALDYGLNVGAGVEINSITIGVQYGLGLANILTVTENGAKASNKVIGVSVGFKFGGK